MAAGGKKKIVGWRDIVRLLIVLPGLAGCYVLIVDTAGSGYARLLCTAAIIQAQLAPADQAVKVAPRDPEAHYTRALSLVNAGRLDDALAEFRQAINLRPHYYYEWLDVGVTLDRVGDHAGAENAIRESVRLAPSFAQPRWQLGNLLYTQARYEEAFENLRQAARSNPNLRNGLFQLAWVSANGDVLAFLSSIQIADKSEHFDIARFLAAQGKGSDAVLQAREAGQPSNEIERDALREAVLQLLRTEQYSEALDVWKVGHNLAAKDAGRLEMINGNFLEPILRGDPGYGWQLPAVENTSVAIDTSGPKNGTRSLRVEFLGDSPPAGQLVNQMLLLPPGSHYAVRFVAKSEGLISGGLPVLVAFSGNNASVKLLGRSAPIAAGTTDWTPYVLDFWTEGSSPVIISLQRQQCSQIPCPVFGKLWIGEVILNSL